MASPLFSIYAPLLLLLFSSLCIASRSFSLPTSSSSSTSTVELKPGQLYSATYDSSKQSWGLKKGKPSGWAAWAVYEEKRKEIGWDELYLETNSKLDDSLQAFGAGFIEGSLTHHIIWDDWRIFYNGTMNFTIPSTLSTWLQNNDQWVSSMVKKNKHSTNFFSQDDKQYWTQVGLVMDQFDGLVAGYNFHAHKDKKLSRLDFLLLEAQNDIGDIIAALGERKPYNSYYDILSDSHCSSLVKVAKDGQKLFAAHDTWFSYEGLLRIYKHYNIRFKNNSTKSSQMSYSSSPGLLPSGDDFYITNSKLAIMETTNNIFNMSLYKYVTTESVLYWVRNIVANRMADNGKDWVNIFGKYNSGTYNNQWIIVDYKLFTPGKPIQPNTLWIAEQIPGYLISGDESQVLSSQGYWPSYNIPYFPFVYNISGYPEQEKIYGDQMSYSKCPRANIFRRDQSTVVDLHSMKAIMRYNKWQTDPFSLGNACNSIAARCDLNPPNTQGGAFGALDCKVTDDKLIGDMRSEAVSSPTWDSQPVFAWTSEWIGTPHYGQATVFDFTFQPMHPRQF